MYKYFFPGNRWDKFLRNTCQKLKKESVLITGLPHCGLTTYLKYIETAYTSITKSTMSVVIYIDIIQESTEIHYLSIKISEKLKNSLSSPKYLKGLSCEEMFSEIIKRKKEIIVIINRFQNLRSSPQTFDFLNSLRAINSLKVRFLIGCDLSCLAYPETYEKAGTIVAANQIVLPLLNEKEIELSLKNFKELFKWNIPVKYSRRILTLSGGVIGLVKYLAKYTHEHGTLHKKNKLLKYQIIEYKVNDIYSKLKKNKLIRQDQLDIAHADILQKLGVLDKRRTLRIGLLELLLTPTTRSIKPNFEKLLSIQEYKLYKLFSDNSSKMIPLDEISEKLWGEEEQQKYSLWSIYKVISNLKSKLKKYGYEIKNYRGRGYTLTKKVNFKD